MTLFLTQLIEDEQTAAAGLALLCVTLLTAAIYGATLAVEWWLRKNKGERE